MKRLITLFLCWSSTLLATSSADQMNKFVKTALEEYGVPGAAVAIVQDGKIVLSKGYGVRKEGESEKVNADTIFQLASVTKPFTAATVALWVQQSQVGWDDPVANAYPGFVLFDSYASHWSTPRDLLAHRTGLPEFRGDLLGDIGYSRDETAFRARFLEPSHSFRERTAYCNLNYLLAGQLVATLSGQEWEAYLQTALLEPLGMHRTGLVDKLSDSNASANHVLRDGNIVVAPVYDSGVFAAAGGMVSTANDLANFMVMLLSEGKYDDKELLEPKQITEMFMPSMVAKVDFSEGAPIEEDSGFAYGMGWNNYHYQGSMIVEKGGGLPGIRTLVTLIPEKRAGIAILANLDFTYLPEAVRAAFLEQVVGPAKSDVQATLLEQQKKARALFAKPNKPESPKLPLAGDLSDYAGVYVNELYGNFELTAKDDTLSVVAGPGAYPGKLSHFSAETFLLTWDENPTAWQEVTFTRGADGKGIRFTTETLGSFTK